MNNLFDFTDTLARELISSGRNGTAHSYLSSARKLIKFTNEKITFDELTPALLKSYEQSLMMEGRKRNSISLYMRMLRSICNQASGRGLTTIPAGLFSDVFTGTDSSEKRAVSVCVIKRISDADLTKVSPGIAFCRDMFLLSFYLRGIPFVDLAYIRKSDIRKGVLHYRRSKTNRPLTVPLEPCALEIIRKYAYLMDRNSPYLLPIIKHPGKDEYRQYQSALRLYNKNLNRLSTLLGLKGKLTSYVARHSWATTAYHHGIPVSMISESLGHSSEKVTYTYLASFGNTALRRANRKVIAAVMSGPHPSAKRMLPLAGKFQETHFR